MTLIEKLNQLDAFLCKRSEADVFIASAKLAPGLSRVARAAMARPWWGHDDDPDPDSEMTRLTCAGCESQINEGDRWIHLEPCQIAALDAALDALEAAAEGVV